MADHTSKTPIEHRDSWRTPPAIFNYFNKRFNFQLDVAASEHNALCNKFYTIENSALERDWDAPQLSYAWCNPPYSNIEPWVNQAAKQAKRGIGCVMLVPADQSVAWFKTAIESANEVVIITSGRLAFINAATGKAVSGNSKGSQVIIWRPYSESRIVTHYIDRERLLKG